jgi:hypothetical protein
MLENQPYEFAERILPHPGKFGAGIDPLFGRWGLFRNFLANPLGRRRFRARLLGEGRRLTGQKEHHRDQDTEQSGEKSRFR